MSALSYYDQFTAIDWERYSVLTGKVSCVAAIVISIVSMIMKYDVGVGIYTLIMGFLIALWEMPMFFCGMKQAEDCKTFFLENLYIKNDLVRSVLYIGTVESITTYLLTYSFIHQVYLSLCSCARHCVLQLE